MLQILLFLCWCSKRGHSQTFTGKYIGSLPAQPKKEIFKDLGIRPPYRMVDTVFTKGTEPQSQVNIVFTTPAVYNPAEQYALVSLGELMSIKLVEKLREEKGGVYGVGAYGSMAKLPYPNASFTISFPCAPENADSLTRAALDELKKIIEQGVNIEDSEKVREQQKRRLEVDLKQNNFRMMNSLYEALFNNNNPADILKKQKNIEGLNPKMLQDAARKIHQLQPVYPCRT